MALTKVEALQDMMNYFDSYAKEKNVKIDWAAVIGNYQVRIAASGMGLGVCFRMAIEDLYPEIDMHAACSTVGYAQLLREAKKFDVPQATPRRDATTNSVTATTPAQAVISREVKDMVEAPNAGNGNRKPGPIHKVKFGGISAVVWKNQFQYNGKTIENFSVNLSRNYKDKTGQWARTDSLRMNDIPKAIEALREAYLFLLKGAEEGEGGGDVEAFV